MSFEVSTGEYLRHRGSEETAAWQDRGKTYKVLAYMSADSWPPGKHYLVVPDEYGTTDFRRGA